MITHFIILILALIGIGESLYLNQSHRKKKALVCVIGNDCAKVWESPYSKTFGVSNEILGIIFYATMAVIEGTLLLGDNFMFMILGEYLLLVGGFIMSCYFLYIQWHVIRAWCFWCTSSAVIVFIMLAVRIIS